MGLLVSVQVEEAGKALVTSMVDAREALGGSGLLETVDGAGLLDGIGVDGIGLALQTRDQGSGARRDKLVVRGKVAVDGLGRRGEHGAGRRRNDIMGRMEDLLGLDGGGSEEIDGEVVKEEGSVERSVHEQRGVQEGGEGRIDQLLLGDGDGVVEEESARVEAMALERSRSRQVERRRLGGAERIGVEVERSSSGGGGSGSGQGRLDGLGLGSDRGAVEERKVKGGLAWEETEVLGDGVVDRHGEEGVEEEGFGVGNRSRVDRDRGRGRGGRGVEETVEHEFEEGRRGGRRVGLNGGRRERCGKRQGRESSEREKSSEERSCKEQRSEAKEARQKEARQKSDDDDQDEGGGETEREGGERRKRRKERKQRRTMGINSGTDTLTHSPT